MESSAITPVWIDTHAHLDAVEFGAEGCAVAQRARALGVTGGVIPAVQVSHFAAVRHLAHACGWGYALGIHPLYVDRAREEDLAALAAALRDAIDDPAFVGMGEIGLDFFVPGLDRERQTRFYAAQLRLAREFDLPVILHVRKSQDALLAGLRRAGFGAGTQTGIAHAFNGSAQQAAAFVDLGFALGFGGAMTFERALNIRRLAASVPPAALVLETDAPDIPPVWLYQPASNRGTSPPVPNSPEQLPRIAQTLAELRGWSLVQTATQTTANALRVLPRLSRALQRDPTQQAATQAPLAP